MVSQELVKFEDDMAKVARFFDNQNIPFIVVGSGALLMCVCNFLFHGVVGEVIWHNSLMPEQFYGGWRVNQHLNAIFHPFKGIPHIQKISWEETKIKKMLNGMESITHIKELYQKSAEKHLARFKALRQQKVLTEEEKAEARAELSTYNKIKRALRNYERKRN